MPLQAFLSAATCAALGTCCGLCSTVHGTAQAYRQHPSFGLYGISTLLTLSRVAIACPWMVWYGPGSACQVPVSFFSVLQTVPTHFAQAPADRDLLSVGHDPGVSTLDWAMSARLQAGVLLADSLQIRAIESWKRWVLLLSVCWCL
jgi:hypothetical protein